jgi:hypothetical protein
MSTTTESCIDTREQLCNGREQGTFAEVQLPLERIR